MNVSFCLQCLSGLTEKTGEKRYKGHADEGNATARHELLHALAFRTRIVVTISLQKIDNTPDTKTGTKSNNKSLKNTNSRVKKFHRLNVAERKACIRTDHRTYRSALLSKI